MVRYKFACIIPNRILEIPCKVCGDYSSGKHYNIFACDGCAGFFKRSIRRGRQYVCKAKESGTCLIDKAHRNQCRACRLAKCQEAGMNKDAVQHERGPRNSTIRKAMTNFFEQAVADRMHFISPNGAPLNLALSKSPSPSLDPMTFPIVPPPPFAPHNIMMPRLPSMAHFPSTTMSPPVSPPSPAVETICESAARLLFMNVQWTKSLASFTSLPPPDQYLLLEESWKELFILGVAQLLPFTDLTPLISINEAMQSEESSRIFLKLAQDFQDAIVAVKQFHMDQYEYTCTRAIVLFKSSFDSSSSSSSPIRGETKSLMDPSSVMRIQDEMQLTLNKYMTATRPEQPLRFGKLLLLLPTMRNVPGHIIEDLFFRRTIGNIPIVRIICDMYKSHQ